jgi:hypothetical protein
MEYKLFELAKNDLQEFMLSRQDLDKFECIQYLKYLIMRGLNRYELDNSTKDEIIKEISQETFDELFPQIH